MKPQVYYIVKDLDNNLETYVNTTKEIENITGIEKTLFNKMKAGELYIINHWQVICDKTRPKEMMYYKNLWRDIQ